MLNNLKLIEKMLDKLGLAFIQMGAITFLIYAFKEFTLYDVLTLFLIGFGCAGISGLISTYTSDPEVKKENEQ